MYFATALPHNFITLWSPSNKFLPFSNIRGDHMLRAGIYTTPAVEGSPSQRKTTADDVTGGGNRLHHDNGNKDY